MFDVSNVIIMLLCVYYQEGKKLGEIVDIGGAKFRLVLSDQPVEEESGVSLFRIGPVSTVVKYFEGLNDNGEV